MGSTWETHECDALVRPGRAAVENLGHANDGTGEVDVACGLTVYSTMGLDLDENEVSPCVSENPEYGRGSGGVRDASGSRPKRQPGR